MLWQLLIIVGICSLSYMWRRRKLYKIHYEIPSGQRNYPLIGRIPVTGTNSEVFQMFCNIILFGVAIWSLYRTWQRRRIYEIHREIPSGLRDYPLVGHSYLFRGNGEARMGFFKKISRISMHQGGLSTVWMGNKLYVAFADPVLAELVYKNCLEKDETIVKYMRKVIGNGSIFAPVNIWRPRRKILAPIFSMKNLNQFVKVFAEQSRIMVHLLEPAATESNDFSIWKYLTTYTFDAVCETSLGVKLNAQSKFDQPILEAFEKLEPLIAERMVKPWLYPDFVYERLSIYKEFEKNTRVLFDFVDELIRIKKNEVATQSAQVKKATDNGFYSFLEMMIQQSGGDQGYTDLELREEVLVIMVAGTDTSAVGAAFATVMLSRHPAVQEKVYKELQEVFGDSDRPVMVTDLPNLKYLEVVIKETLRLYPPVPVTVREVREDLKLPNGTTLVEGVSIFLLIWAMHRNPEYWGSDAEQFRPERFLEGPLKNPMQFQPFSYSNRNCLGSNYAMMSMKTVLAELLRHYQVLPPADLDPAMLKEPLRVKHDIMMKHVEDYRIRLKLRNTRT